MSLTVDTQTVADCALCTQRSALLYCLHPTLYLMLLRVQNAELVDCSTLRIYTAYKQQHNTLINAKNRV